MSKYQKISFIRHFFVYENYIY